MLFSLTSETGEWLLNVSNRESVEKVPLFRMESLLEHFPLGGMVLLLVVGIGMVIVGGEWFVDGALLFSRSTGTSQRTVGLTLVAMGTSLPELTSTVSAAIQKYGDIALGNVLGSNVCNTFLIGGVGILLSRGFAGFSGMRVQESVLRVDVPLFILFSSIFLLLANDSGLSRSDGLVLLLLLVAFLYIVLRFRKEKNTSSSVESASLSSASIPWKRILALVTGGLAFLIAGGYLAVEMLAQISERTGFARYSLSAILLALGTSLPELVVGMFSFTRQAPYLALGNILGSNIFNLTGILGISATIHPTSFLSIYNVDVGMVLVASLLMWLNPYSRGRFIPRPTGWLLLTGYLVYLVYLVKILPQHL